MASEAVIPAGRNKAVVFLRGLAGAIVGGIAGYFVFRLLSSRGMFGYAIPGAMVGLGAGLLAGGRSHWLGALCAVAGLCLTIFAEWSVAPFVADQSFQFFVTHVHQLNNFSVKASITAVGVVLAYLLGQGR
jgi:hypothetical protein